MIEKATKKVPAWIKVGTVIVWGGLAVNGVLYLKIQVNQGLDGFAKGRVNARGLVEATREVREVPVVKAAEVAQQVDAAIAKNLK